MNKLLVFITTGFGSGFFPRSPGTAASLVAGLIVWFIPLPAWFILLLTLGGVYLCGHAENILKEHDSPHIVFDEFCGMFWATWQLDSLPHFVIAFGLFRLLDIKKPYPINILQKLPRGWGVMADDLAAGLFTRILVQILIVWQIG